MPREVDRPETADALSGDHAKTDAERASALVDRGLALYGAGLEADAVAVWKAALRLDPQNAGALDYLESAGHPQPHREPLARVLDMAAQRAAREQAEATVELELKGEGGRESDELGTLELALLGQLGRPVPLSALRLAASLPLDATVLHGLVDGRRTVEGLLDLSGLGLRRAARGLAGALLPAWIRSRPTDDAPAPSPAPSVPLRLEKPRRTEAATAAASRFDWEFERGMEAYLRGQFDLARDLFEACERERPGDSRVRINLARLQALGRPSERS